MTENAQLSAKLAGQSGLNPAYFGLIKSESSKNHVDQEEDRLSQTVHTPAPPAEVLAFFIQFISHKHLFHFFIIAINSYKYCHSICADLSEK